MKPVISLPQNLQLAYLGPLFLTLLVLGTDTAQAANPREFTGLATVYASGYDLPTATGEAYDADLYTFSGSNFGPNHWVKITNKTNGKVAYARQNDELRAPESYRMLAKVSLAVADELGFSHEATVSLELAKLSDIPEKFFKRREREVLLVNQNLPNGSGGLNDDNAADDKGTLPEAPKLIRQYNMIGKAVNLSGYHGVQLISLSSYENALNYASQPQVASLGTIYWETYLHPGNAPEDEKLFYRIMVGKYDTKEAAVLAAEQFRRAGFRECKARIYE
jgi:hypothetical protein